MSVVDNLKSAGKNATKPETAETATAVAAAETAEKLKTPTALVNPESQGYVNATISATVKEIFASLAPILQQINSPERLAEAERLRRAPDPATIARNERERRLMAEELDESRRNKEARQEACSHRHGNGTWAVSLISNYPDRQQRAVCHICEKFFHPRQWQIGAPDRENPRGKPYIEAETEGYKEIVQQVSVQQGIGRL